MGVSAKRPCRQRKTSFFQYSWANIFFLQPHPVFFSPKSFVFITWDVFMSKKWGFQPNGYAVSEKPRFFSFFGQNFFSSATPCFFLTKKFRFYHVGCFHEQKVGVSAKRPCRQRKTSFFQFFGIKIFFLHPHPVFFSPKSFVFITWGVFMSKKWGFQPNGHAVSEKPRFFSFLGQHFFSSATPCFFLAKKIHFYHLGCFHEQKVGVSA